MTFRRFYRRRFLNRRGHHAGAFVLADIRIETWRDDHALREVVDDFADALERAADEVDMGGHRSGDG